MNDEKLSTEEKYLTAESFQERIRSLYDQLTPAQQKVVLLFRKKWEQICMMTAKEVGQKAGVSEATVQRIAVCLGFKSFRSMKMQMRGSLLKNRAVVNFKLKDEQGADKASWLDEHVGMEVANLMQTFRLNGDEAFRRGAGLLIRAGRIWVLGSKMGSGVSAYLSFALNYLIGKTVLLNLSDCAEYLSSMDEKDALVVVGFQRYSRSTLKAAEIAKGRGAKLLVFTDCDLSPFAKISDAALYALTDSAIFLDSYSAALSVAHALIAMVVRLDRQNIRIRIENTEEVYRNLNQ